MNTVAINFLFWNPISGSDFHKGKIWFWRPDIFLVSLCRFETWVIVHDFSDLSFSNWLLRLIIECMLASGTWFLLEGRTNAYLINQSEKANAHLYIIYVFNTYARFQWEHKCIYLNHPSAPQRVCTVMPALKSIAKLFKRCAMCASRIMIIGGAHHVAQKLWRFPSISELYRCK